VNFMTFPPKDLLTIRPLADISVIDVAASASVLDPLIIASTAMGGAAVVIATR
jgi:hypothetical protein